MNSYGFVSFEEWYNNNYTTAKLCEVEEQFDLTAIPERRINKATLSFRVTKPNVMLDCIGNLISVYEDTIPDGAIGMKIKSDITYLPALLVKLRESGLEVVKIYTTDKAHQLQLDSINEKLSAKEKFALSVSLV